jgi:uncharacterized membrane protein YidH (DUF202 family)
MTGYRDTSSFDPNAGGEAPMRPFNKWQWIGVAMIVAGTLVMVAMLAVRLAWHQATKDDWIPLGSSLGIFGTVLVNSRRQPGGFTPETRRKRMVIVAVGLMLFGAAVITIFVLKGV